MAEDDYVDGGGLSPYSDPFKDAAPQVHPVEHVWFSQAAVDVLAERRRQVEAEGWTPEHDDKHTHSEMALAAACYALPSTARSIPFTYGQDSVRQRLWPWDIAWWKPKDRRRDLVKAAALILAEIERLDRAS